MAWPQIALGQMVRQVVQCHVVAVIRKGVVGTPQRVQQMLAASGTSTVIDTAFIERLNATFRYVVSLPLLPVRKRRGRPSNPCGGQGGMITRYHDHTLLGCYQILGLHAALRPFSFPNHPLHLSPLSLVPATREPLKFLLPKPSFFSIIEVLTKV